MKKSTPVRMVFAALVTALVAGLAACTQGGAPIYATIQAERKTTDSTLPNTLNVAAISSPAAGVYYVAAGTLYQGILASGTVTWTPSDTANASRVYNPGAGVLVNALEISSTTAFGGFVSAGADLGMYEAAVGAGTNYAPTSWSPTTDPVVAGKQVLLLKAAGSGILGAFATPTGTAGAYQYELDYWNGTSWAAIPSVTALARPITGIAYDGSLYYYSSGATVYSSATATGTYAADKTVSGDTVNGLGAGGTRVIALTKASGAFVKVGGTWKPATVPVVGSATPSLLSADGPVNGGGTLYLVGSDGYGYYSLDVAPATPTLTRSTVTTIGLYTASIGQIVVDGTTVLMGTHGLGTWRATFDSNGALSGTWTHE